VPDRSYTAVVGSNGQATVTIQTLKSVKWIVSQISVEMTNAPSGATCVIRKNGSMVTPLVAAGDAATGDPPIELWPTDAATVTWTGATPGLVAKVFAIFDEEPYP
jgi:hypothetical protein